MKSVRQVIAKDSGNPRYSVEDVGIPQVQSNEVMVEVKACSLSLINPKVIFEVFCKEPRDSYCVGQDVSGVVVRAGEGVTHVRVGDEVVGVLPLDSPYSGCGKYCVFNEYDIVKKPRMLSHEVAAAGIGDCVRAYTALHYHARVCGGDTVLIVDGALSFGSVAVQLARSWGAKVIATVSSEAEKSYLESLQTPVAQTIELGPRSNILVSSVMEETGGLGVDVIVDNGVRMFNSEEDIKLMSEKYKYPKPHKQDVISCLGISGKWVTSHFDLQLDPPDSQQLFLRGGSVSFLFDQAWTLSYTQQGRYQHMLQDAVDKLDRGMIKTKVAKTVTLENVIEELKTLDECRIGKVVMTN